MKDVNVLVAVMISCALKLPVSVLPEALDLHARKAVEDGEDMKMDGHRPVCIERRKARGELTPSLIKVKALK